MSEDRETHEITTPVKGHIVVLKSWINGREKQRIDGSMFNNVSTEGEGAAMKPKLSESVISGRENASIECVVVSVDGNSDDVVDQVLDMRAKDYEFVLKQVEEVTEGNFDEKKETSSETNTINLSLQDEEESLTSVSL